MRGIKKHERRGFSIVELLIALAITSTLLTATMAALDASFKGYKATSEGASTHVVSRIVMQRLTSMIRTGDSFGPYPVNPILTPNIESTWIEFVSFRDPSTNEERITRLERRDGEGENGPYELWYVVTTYIDGSYESDIEAPLLVGLNEVRFDLEYDVGPRLKRATIDLVIQPNDLQDAGIAGKIDTPTIRLVASAAPRLEGE
jgi:prepilin-type N-terminal cleavage/methylation domain-containing protein